MSGILSINTNKYALKDETVTAADGVKSFPFRCTRLLDIIINIGPDEAIITLDNGDPIPLLAGEYRGPWTDFQCSTIEIQTQGTVRVKAVGI